MSNRPSTFLRCVLFADAAISGVSGLLMALGAGQLSALLGLPEPVLRYAGLALLPWAALVAWLALRDAPPRVAVGAVILGNLLWAADCVVILLAGWVEPTGLGLAFVLAQALTVALLAELQYFGLRRTAAPA